MAISIVAVNEECPHCHNYVSEKEIDILEGKDAKGEPVFKTLKVCGDCALKETKRPGTLAAERRHAAILAEGRRKADKAAKDAFLEEMRKLNAEEVEAVVGEGSKAARTAEAK